MKNLFTIILLLNSNFCFAQIEQTFQVIDSVTSKPIAYAEIIPVNRGSGLYTDTHGFFNTQNDSVKIHCIGYYTKLVNLQNTDKKIFLRPKIYNLSEIPITPEKRSKNIEIGYLKEKSDLSISGTSGKEIAVFIPNSNNREYQLIKLIFKIDKRKIVYESLDIKYVGVYKINFYSVEKDYKVGNTILNKSLYFKTDNLKKRVILDISKSHIIFPEKGLFVGIEWVGKEDITNKNLYILSKELLPPIISTTFNVKNPIVYERNKLNNKIWMRIDKNHKYTRLMNKHNGFTPLISIICN